jgi:hypothetical protein
MMLDNSDSPELIKEIHQLLLNLQQPLQAPNIPSPHLGEHRGDRDAENSTAAYHTSTRSQENELQARISQVNYQRTMAANRSVLVERQRRSLVTNELQDSLPYHTRQTQSPPILSDSPTLWIDAFEKNLTENITSETTSLDDKRSRKIQVLETLSSLNSYLSSISDKVSRQNLRQQLEEGRALARVFEKALRVSKGAVVIRKLIETYEDDKAEDDIE